MCIVGEGVCVGGGVVYRVGWVWVCIGGVTE